jgi:membrane protease YdiL (CAAX protease family)
VPLPLEKDDATISILKILGGLILFIALIAALFNMIQKNDMAKYQTTNRTLRKMVPKTTALCLTAIPLLIGINALSYQVRILFKVPLVSDNQNIINTLTKSSNIYIGIYLCIVGILIAPIIEEIIFRYMMLNKVFDENHQRAGIITSIVIFALLHMVDDFSGHIVWGSVIADIIIYGSMATVFTWIYVKTDNLKYSITVHITNNLISFIPLLAILIPKIINTIQLPKVL